MSKANHLPEVVNLRCDRCGRAGRYRRERYLEISGTKNAADALLSFAKAVGCETALRQAPDQLHDRCGIRYQVRWDSERDPQESSRIDAYSCRTRTDEIGWGYLRDEARSPFDHGPLPPRDQSQRRQNEAGRCRSAL